MKSFISTMFALLFCGLTGYGIFRFLIYVERVECEKWGGSYHWTTHCIMEKDGVRITLADYKKAQAASITKPITTNSNITLGITGGINDRK